MRRKIVNADWTTIIGLAVLIIVTALMILYSVNHQKKAHPQVEPTAQMVEVRP